MMHSLLAGKPHPVGGELHMPQSGIGKSGKSGENVKPSERQESGLRIVDDAGSGLWIERS